MIQTSTKKVREKKTLYERQQDATERHFNRILVGRLRQKEKDALTLFHISNSLSQKVDKDMASSSHPLKVKSKRYLTSSRKKSSQTASGKKSTKSIGPGKNKKRKVCKKKQIVSSNLTPKIRKSTIITTFFRNTSMMHLGESDEQIIINKFLMKELIEESSTSQSSSRNESKSFSIPRLNEELLKQGVISVEEMKIIKDLNDLDLPPKVLQRLYKEGLIHHYHYAEGKRGKYFDPENLCLKVYNCQSLINQRVKVIMDYFLQWEPEDEKNDVPNKNDEDVVPRWRRRIETDHSYQRLQVTRTIKESLQKAVATQEERVTKSPSELINILAKIGFYEWNLQWEKTQLSRFVDGSITLKQLQKIYKCSIPDCSPASLFSMLSVKHISIRKRVLIKGSTVYEVFDMTNDDTPIMLLVEETSTTKFFSRRRTTYHGKDTQGNNILRVVITHSIPSNCMRLKVYFPPAVFIGCIVQKWTLIQPEYAVKDGRFKVQGIVRMNGTQIPCFGPYTWRTHRTITYNIDMMNGWSKGLIRGEWKRSDDEPEFGIYFPKHIGLLTKVMLTVASILVFHDFFGKKLRGNEIYYY